MFGIGKIKFAPGTFGSLATVIILFYLFHSLSISPIIILIGLIFVFIFSFYAISAHTKDFKNSFRVIMDDVCAGFYVVLTLVCFMIIKSYVL